MKERLAVNNISQVISLCNVSPHRSRQHCRLFSCAKLLMGCGSTMHRQTIFLCSVGTGRSRQHYIGYFPAKTCLCALRQHWTSIIFVQFCRRRTTLTRQYSYASIVVPVWSIQHCIGYFLHKSCLLAMGQYYTGKNLVKCCPGGSRQ